MNSSLKRTLALVVLGLAVWSGWYGWQGWKTRRALEALESVARSADLNKLLSDPPEEVRSAVDLAVRGISLSQGYEGRKSFDLKADWATLNQDSGAITVREPDIQYMLKNLDSDEERIIRATSDVGRVEDGNQKVSMSGNVQATYEENVLTGELAVFLNTARTLTFPDGAELNGPALSGTATRLMWDLDTNTLTGNEGVRMRWMPSDSDTTAGGAADASPSSDAAPQGAQEESQS